MALYGVNNARKSGDLTIKENKVTHLKKGEN